MATQSKFFADLGIKSATHTEIDGNLSVSGNLTVQGTQTTIDSTTKSVADSMIELASGNTSADIKDIGIYGNYNDGIGSESGVSEYTGLFRDASDSTWKLFDGLEEEPSTTVNVSGTNYSLADLQVGDLTATTLTATNGLTGSSITYPTSDGTNGQVIKTNGSGTLSFGDIPAGYSDSDARSAISAGTGISYNSSTGVITNTVSDTNTTYSAGTGLNLSGTTFSSTITQYADSDVETYLDGGTSTPTFSSIASTGTLNINPVSSGDAVILLQNGSDAQTLRLDQNSIRTTTSNNLTLFTSGNTSQLHLNQSDGSIGVGTASPNRLLSVSTDKAKTDTNTAYPFAVQSNEGSNQAQLSVHAIGGANAAARKWIFQTEEAGVANDGIISFQPYGGKTQIGSSSGAYTFAEKLIVGDGDANDGITIQSGTTHQGNIAFAKGGGTTALGRILYQHDTDYMSFMVNNSEKVKVNKNGQVVMPEQPAFNVAKNNGYVQDNNWWIPDYVVRNVGSHYSTSTGRFTAPVAGTYFFSASIMTHDSSNAASQVEWKFYKNTSAVKTFIQHKTGDYHTRVDGSIVLELDVNDYVRIYVGNSGTSSGWAGSQQEQNNFCGFLIG